MQLSHPFIRLPFRFDTKRLEHECAQYPQSAWMPHPSGMKGNSALPLISRGGMDNNEFEGAMAVTAHLARGEYLQQVMACFGEVLGRSRLMRLAPGCEVSAHVDFNYHWYSRVRIHIPVITNPEVIFHCGGQALHMQAGECWLFDSWARHRVVNASPHSRTHLVIDTAGSARFWQTVRAMQQFDWQTERDAIERQVQEVPWVAGKAAQVRTEKYNIAPVMSPGEVDALVQGVVADFMCHPDNDTALAASYRDFLNDFASDWREVWHLHGYQPSGWPHYQQLIDRVQACLHPNRRALVTASNDVGVNPIIVQRILRAALATDEHGRFLAKP